MSDIVEKLTHEARLAVGYALDAVYHNDSTPQEVDTALAELHGHGYTVVSVSEIQRLRDEVASATTYAERLAVFLHGKHYAEVTEWKPLSGDLIGLLTQINNMVSGLTSRAEAFERAAQIAEQWEKAMQPGMLIDYAFQEAAAAIRAEATK